VHGALEDFGLPTPPSDDQIDLRISGGRDSYYPRKGIVGITATDLDLGAMCRELSPERRIETAIIDGEKIEISGGARNAMNGERHCSDHGVGNSADAEDSRHVCKQRQESSASIHALLRLRACLRRSISRRATSSAMPWDCA
jgi:hypothetical protein